MSDLQVGPDLVQITLQADPAQPLACSGCQRPGLPVHEYCRRHVRDLPMLDKAVWLRAYLARIDR